MSVILIFNCQAGRFIYASNSTFVEINKAARQSQVDCLFIHSDCYEKFERYIDLFKTRTVCVKTNMSPYEVTGTLTLMESFPAHASTLNLSSANPAPTPPSKPVQENVVNIPVESVNDILEAGIKEYAIASEIAERIEIYTLTEDLDYVRFITDPIGSVNDASQVLSILYEKLPIFTIEVIETQYAKYSLKIYL